MNTYRANYNRIIFFTCFAIVMIVIGIQTVQFLSDKQWNFEDLRTRLKEHAMSLEMKAQTVRDYTQGLKIAAENKIYYQNKKTDHSYHFRDIIQNPDGKTYALNVANMSIKKDKVGNLTGLGNFSTLSENVKKEIKMALSLNTVFELALKNNPGVMWVYYTSTHGFQNLFPWLPSSDISYYEKMQGRSFLTKGLPANNPSRKNYWTEIYRDGVSGGPLYQKGYVVTNCSPVYDGDSFLGVVSIDLALRELERLLSSLKLPVGSSALVNEDDQILAMQGFPTEENKAIHHIHNVIPPSILKPFINEFKSPQAKIISLGNYYIYVHQLTAAPWRLVYVVSAWDLFNTDLCHAFENVIIITIILILVIGLGYFVVIRDFISPAQKLLTHIERENKGLPIIYKDIPERWKSWFEIVSRIFAENRVLLTDLENRVQARTNELQEKNKELEKALNDLKKAQNQIIVQEKLASLGSLTAGIAHEIKNPLNFIINFTDLSLDYLKELQGLNDHEKDLLALILANIEKVKEHAHRADSIVKGMLLHANSNTSGFEKADLNIVLEEALELALSGFQMEGAHFHVQVEKRFATNLPLAKISVGDISRVFLNMLNNSCYAMAEKLKKDKNYEPRIILKTREIEDFVEVTIEDNGPGIPQSIIAQIFTPFFTTKDPGKGTGLGLSLSYDIIVQQHRGALEVKSKLGKNTKFIVRLPIS